MIYLKRGDTASGPQEPQVPGLDIQKVEEVPRCVEQRPGVEDVEVVAAAAVVAEAVAKTEALPGEVAADFGGISVSTGLSGGQ